MAGTRSKSGRPVCHIADLLAGGPDTTGTPDNA